MFLTIVSFDKLPVEVYWRLCLAWGGVSSLCTGRPSFVRADGGCYRCLGILFQRGSSHRLRHCLIFLVWYLQLGFITVYFLNNKGVKLLLVNHHSFSYTSIQFTLGLAHINLKISITANIIAHLQTPTNVRVDKISQHLEVRWQGWLLRCFSCVFL